MKKITLFLFLFVFSLGYSQTISFTDINFKTVLLYADTNHFMATNVAGDYVKIDANNDGEIQVSEALNIYKLIVYDSGIATTAISIQNIEGIQYFTNLKELSIPNCLVQELNFNANLNLEVLSVGTNLNLTSLILPDNNLLKSLYVPNTNISSIDLSNQSALIDIRINNTPITSVDFSNCPNLQTVYCYSTLITNLDVSANPLLGNILCANIPVENLDFSNNPNLGSIGCGGSTLKSLNVKNGSFALLNLDGNFPSTNLIYLCCDENERAYITGNYSTTYPNCNINTYCSFNPGGTYYTINGNIKFDADVNGCDASDTILPNLKFDINSNSSNGSFYGNTSGNYSIPLEQGNYTVTPRLENPNYFSISPASFSVQFPVEASPYNQNFCITPNGIHYDLEVVFTRLKAQIPGIDVPYTLIFKNKGNQLQSGTITLNFDDAIMDFVSSNPAEASVVTDQLTWNYIDLKPFETREITFIMNLNSPMEIPALNNGDRIEFTGNIQPNNNSVIDDYPEDNNIDVSFGVVNSADPNDITCLEGNLVGPDKIGKYVHYMIRFENIGTANAMNVVVKNLIDTNKFDISTLTPLYSNYDFITKQNSNQFEFIFENINLPFDDGNNDGYLVYKIKLKNNLVVGDTFSNQANIYFDFNFPIVTNMESTMIQTLDTDYFSIDNKISIYPNPTSEVINIQIENSKDFNIEIYDFVGKHIGTYKNQKQIDVSNLTSGLYIVKIMDLETKQSTSQKVIKK